MSDSVTNYNYVRDTKISVSIKNTKRLGRKQKWSEKRPTHKDTDLASLIYTQYRNWLLVETTQLSERYKQRFSLMYLTIDY